MRVCIAGCGTMGTVYADNLCKMEGVQLAGVFDREVEKSEIFSNRYRTSGFISFEEMMKQVDPDVVCITMPTFLHKEYVIKAAEWRKHVICEKPIAMNLSEAKEMVQACKQNQVRLFIGHVVRFFPEYAALKQEIESGVIGEIGVAHAKRVGPHPGAARWYGDSVKSGGVIMDLMIHDIDFMRWSIGEVKSVYTLNKKTGDMDYASVTLRFHNGAIANLVGFWGYPGAFSTSVEIAGKKGMLRWDSDQAKSLVITKKEKAIKTSSGAVVPQCPAKHDPFYYEVLHFLDCLQNGTTPIVTAEDACKALEIVYAAMESSETGQPIQLGEGSFE
jgi:UDP-N-acetylglucosamine 3-dehydrogenase